MTKISNQYSLTNVLTADTTNGRVGVGTTSPNHPLTIKADSSANGINIIAETGGYAQLSLSSAGNTLIGNAITQVPNSTSYDMYLSTYNGTSRTTKMAITGAGNVGIGTAAPNEKLDVNGAIQFSGGSQGYASTTSVGMVDFYAGLTRVLSFGSNGSTYGGFDFYQATQNNGVSRSIMRITSAGNIGIGTTSPVAMLSFPVNTANSQISTGSLEIQSYGTNNSWIGDNIYFNGSGFIARTTGYVHQIYFGTTAGIRFLTGDSSVSAGGASNATETYADYEWGNVLIGTTTDSSSTWKLQVNSLIATLGTDAALVYQNRNDSTRYTFYATGGISYFFNGGNIAQINMSNGAYTALSDVNKKKDFEQSNIGLNEVLQLKPTLYRMKTDSESSSKELGFIAQEVKDLIPQAYVESNDGDDKFIGLNQMPLIAALTKAVQQQQTQINELKALINA